MQLGDIFERRYRIDSLLGSGGFAHVFGAWDLRDQRAVALKLFQHDQTLSYSADVRARFGREARAVAALDSPHIVQMYDHGESAAGELFIVFERIEGRDLQQILADEGKISPAHAEYVLRQLLDALEVAHAAGLLHRDLKPENIRVFSADADAWRVKLLDFGIVRPMDNGSPAVTATGAIVGTPRYMSPEQLTEAPLTPASDIYSLGIVAFEMLVGPEQLHGRSWMDQLDRLQTGHLFAAPGYDDVQDLLRGVVTQMTARDVQARPQTIAEVRELLDISTAPTDKLKPPSARKQRAKAAARAAKMRRQDRKIIVGVLTIVAVLAAVAAFLGREEPGGPPPSPVLVRASPQPTAPTPVAAPQQPDASVDTGVEDGCDGNVPVLGFGPLNAGWDPAFRYVPKGYDGVTKVPLLLLLHDELNPASSLIRQGTFGRLADEKGFLIVAPEEGMIRPWHRPTLSGPRLAELVETMKVFFCVDSERIYAVGHGDGGRVVEYLANQPWIAAAATHSFRQRDAHWKYLRKKARAVPFLLLSPSRSQLVMVEGGKHCGGIVRQPLKSVEKLWRDRNGCRTTPVENVKPGTDDTVCNRWKCDTPFTSCVIDGGFSFPGLPQKMNNPLCNDSPATTFDTPAFIWTFFESTMPQQVRAVP